MPASRHRPICVLLADDDASLRQSLRSLLHAEGDMEVVGSAADGAEAVQLARAHIPDVAILEMKMRGMDGIQALRAIREASPNTRTIVFTGDISRKALREAIRAGAHAVLLKRSAAELSAAVRRVLAGERFVNECALKAAFSPEIGASRSSLS